MRKTEPERSTAGPDAACLFPESALAADVEASTAGFHFSFCIFSYM